MRIAELSRQTGVSVPTIKYYLRDGMLPAGTLTKPNQAEYDDRHVRRIKLIRALIEVGNVSTAVVKDVLAAIDEPTTSIHDMLGKGQRSITPQSTRHDGPELDATIEQVREMAAARGWLPDPDNGSWQTVADVLVTVRLLGLHGMADRLNDYADVAERAAKIDLQLVAGLTSVDEMVEVVVVGTTLGDVLLSGLRRLAQDSESARLLEDASADDTAAGSGVAHGAGTTGSTGVPGRP